MDEIRHREPGAPEGLTVVADQQTAGRGRMGRTWRDEPGQSLLFSTLLRPDCEPADFRLFPVAAGLAVARAVAECYAIEANVKWPNDVLIEDRKVAGILVTTRIGEGRIMSATIGVGVNLHTTPTIAEMQGAALQEFTDRPIEPNDLLQVVLRHLEEVYSAVLRGDAAPLVHAWTSRAAWLGEIVDVALPSGTVRGRFEGIDAAGHLLLRNDDGSTEAIAVGDVTRGIRRTGNDDQM
jgi:BirA family biotin operon repressor/biotin-[acetyl-CoA-carboxylase] ligase